MSNVIDVLRERGFIEQTTHEQELIDHFESQPVNCYIGFDPTASSLHIGSLVPIMALGQLQRHGHRPIALIGGGTGLVGDPSGKTELRKLLTIEIDDKNAIGIKKQLSRFIEFSNNRALMVNNADWLTKLAYIPFLRDIGRHFSVNRMLKAESCRLRLESEEGLSFIEFNYMLLQAYDFLELYDQHQCRVQMGGSDQWGNIVAGIELIRRIRQDTAFGITFPLITTSSGTKMGKTAAGAIWLDPERTSPYDYFQYWINTDDRDVERFMALFTYLPLEEIQKVGKLEGADLNSAKTVLAYEATALLHGRDEATKALMKTESNFGNRQVPEGFIPSSRVHTMFEPDSAVASSSPAVEAVAEVAADSTLAETELQEGIPAFKLFQMVGLVKSGGEARRLIEQGGAYVNAQRVTGFDQLITDNDLDQNMMIILRSGKKRYHKIRVEKHPPR